MYKTMLMALLLLAACKTPPNQVPQPQNASTPPKADATPKPVSPASDKVEVLPFDQAKAGEFAFKGTLKTGAMWKDKNGENTLVISQTIKNSENGKLEEILGYHYVSKAGKDSLFWQIKDWADNPCDEAPGVVSDVVVKDVNGDGVAENAFVYGIAGNCDVSPRDFKLMMHSGAAKYAIRGNTLVALPPEKIGGEKNFDAAFQRAPSGFKSFASELWDKTIQPMNIKM